MAEGVTIGRVKVKVYPDTSGFRRDLKNDLDRIEKGLSIEVDALLNSKMLARHADAVVKRMNSKAERAKRQIIFDADLDANNIQARARAVSAEVDRALRDAVLDLSTKLDEDSLRKTRHELDEIIDDYDGKDVELQTTVDSVVARAELARVSRDRFVNLHVQVSKASIARAEATLAALSGLRLLGSTLDNLKNLFKNLDKNIPLIGTIAEAVMGLTAWLLAAASNTFTLARSLAQIGGLALTLPGIMGGLAFGLGATVAVLKDFNAVLPEVGREFSRIQDVMSRDFWSLAEGPIRNLTNTLLPQLEGGLRVTSAALGRFFGGLADSIRGSLDGSLDGMFANLAASIDIASESNGRLANAIRILGTTGSKYLPRLAGWYNNIAQAFSTWLTKAESTGRLNEIIETAITNAKDLGSVLFNAGGILAGIARAAEKAGGSSLGMLADTLERIHKTVDSPGFQSGLIDVLTSAHQAMSLIANQSGPAVKAFFRDFSSTLADGFRTAGDAIGHLLDGIFRGLNTDGFAGGFLDFLDGIRDGIKSLEPMWEPLGEAIGAIGTLAGSLARNFGPLLEQVLTSLATMVTEIAPLVEPVVEALTGALGDALRAILPVVETLVVTFANIAGPLLSTEAGVGAVTAALVAFKVAISAKAIETGIATLLSFFGASGKAAGMSAALGTLATKLGLVAGAVAGAVALKDWLAESGKAKNDIDDITAALERLASTGSSSDMQKFEEMFGGKGSWWEFGAVDRTSEIHGLSDAFERLVTSSKGFWEATSAGKTGPFESNAFAQAKQSVEDFDKALAAIVGSGNTEALASAQEYLAEVAKDNGVSVQALADKYLPEYSNALEINAAAQQAAAKQAAEASAQQSYALSLYEDAIARVNGLSPQTIQALNDVSKEFIDLGAALEGDALPSVDAWLSKLEEQQAAMTAWADNMAALARRGVSEGVLVELARLGTDGAPMVAQLVNASDSELARLESVMKSKAEGAVSSTTGAFAELDSEVKAELDKLPPEARAVLEEMGVLMNQGGANAVEAMAVGMNSQGQYVYTSADGIARTAAQALSNSVPTASQHGAATAAGFTNAVGSKTGEARSAGSKLGSAAAGGASSVSLYGIGQNVGQGFANGLSSVVSTAVSAARTMVANVAASATSFLGIHSPSRLFHGYGEWVTIGFAEGIEDKGAAAVRAMKSVVKDVASVDFQDPLAGRGRWSTRTGSAAVAAAVAEGGAPVEGVTVVTNFNAPVGGDPYEIAAAQQQKVLDGLNAEGLIT